MFTKPPPSSTQQFFCYVSNIIPSSETIKKIALATITSIALGSLFKVVSITTQKHLSNYLAIYDEKNDMLTKVIDILGQNNSTASPEATSWWKSSYVSNAIFFGGGVGLSKPIYYFGGKIAQWGVNAGITLFSMLHHRKEDVIWDFENEPSPWVIEIIYS